MLAALALVSWRTPREPLSGAGAAPELQAPLAEDLAALQQAFDGDLQALATELSGLTQPEAERRCAEFIGTVLAGFIDELAGLARSTLVPGERADVWLRLVQCAGMMSPLTEGSRVHVRAALAGLLAQHVDHPRLLEVATNLRFFSDEPCRAEFPALLRELARRSPVRNVQAEARLSLAALLGEGCVRDDPRLGQAFPLLAELERDYAELASPLGPSYADAAARMRFAFEHLSPGGPAPDFSALDSEGVSFRLSDYRGQVVLLEFWGFWCKGCVAQIPHVKELVARFAGAPFAVLGINNDGPAAELRPRLVEAGITWRNAVEPSEDTLASRWNISGYPTLILIDAQGILRRNWHVPPKADVLAAEVERVVAEARREH